MKPKISLLIICGLLLLPGNVLQAENIEVSYQLERLIFTQQLPIWPLVESEYDQLPKEINNEGELAVDREERYLIQSNEYVVGYIEEADGYLQAKQETMKFAIDKFSRGGDYRQQKYDIELSGLYQEVRGIVLGKNIFPEDKSKWDLFLIGKLLQGQRLSQRHYNAEIEIIEDKPYLTGFRDGIYSELNEIDNVEFTSYGYSVGSKLEWQIKQDLTVNLTVENLYSWIKWNDVYTSVMKYENTSLGFYSFNGPNSETTGNYSYEDYVTHLQPEYDAKVRVGRSEIGVFYRYKFYPYVSYRLFSSPLRVEPGLYREYVTLDLGYRAIRCKLKTKVLDFTTASGLQTTIEVKFKF